MEENKVKKHLRENKKTYISVGVTAIVVAGITYIIMRHHSKTYSIRHELLEPAQHELLELGQKNTIINSTLNNVSFISSNRKGPPSWVIRCLETNEIFTSQNEAARIMNLSISDISRHLNGLKDNVNGYHFERICMAA